MKIRFTLLALVGLSSMVGCASEISDPVSNDSQAIVSGEVTGTAYSNVVLVGWKTVAGEFKAGCTGFMIAPTIVVTAHHCATRDRVALYGPGTLGVDNSPAFDPTGAAFNAVASIHSNPATLDPGGSTGFSAADVAVLRLTSPVTGITPFTLASAGEANSLKNNTTLNTVGFGQILSCPKGPGQCELVPSRIRRFAEEKLNSSAQWFLTVQQNPSAADSLGGICLADSGGPHFLPGTNRVFAVSTFNASSDCHSTSREMRIDTPEVLTFLNSFL